MMVAPPTGGILLDHHWLLAWALVPAGFSILGVVIALTSRTAPAKDEPSRTGP